MLLLEYLELTDFRNYGRRRFDFESESVFLLGGNGRGKTNVLEAIYFLSILRSFRTGAVRELIRLGAPGFRLQGGMWDGRYRRELAIEQQRGGGRSLWIERVPVRRSSEFIREFRTVAFVPEDKWLVSGAAGVRRRFFDMLLSILEPGYLVALQRYCAALAQRNAALRRRMERASVAAFEWELAEKGVLLGRIREEYCSRIVAELNRIGPSEGYGARYVSNFPPDAGEYAKQLEQGFERDQKAGFTNLGPQSDDMVFFRDGKELRHYGSTGQQRLCSLYLRMAEFELLSRNGEGVVALVDDVTGELDPLNKEKFFTLLARARQRFFTVTALPDAMREQSAQTIDLGKE